MIAEPGPEARARIVRYVPLVTGRGAIDGFRRALFVATGLAVPLYAFPVLRALGREIDLATVLAALFVLSSLGSYRRNSAADWLWLAAAAVVPALVLISPVPSDFHLRQFLVSGGHWLLLIAFFFSCSSLEASERARTRIALWNLAGGALVALFAVYQVFGTPRHWPGTGPILVSFQREPLRLTWIGGFSQEGSYTRPSSVFLEPSWMGGYLSWVLVLGAAAVLAMPGAVRSRARPFAIVGLALVLLAIAASVSWGAYVDLGVGAGAGLAALWLGRRFSAGRTALVIAAAAFLVALAALSPPGRRVVGAVSERWEKLASTPLEETATEAQQQDSSWLRVRNLAHTSRLFRAHALRGIGLGQFANYEKPGEPLRPSFRDPWCGWVAIAAEMGVLGPVVLLGPLLLILRRWWRGRYGGLEDIAVPALLAIAVVQQFHTASFLDLWWWYPVSVASALCGPSAEATGRPRRGQAPAQC
jgi:hypothetical protein